MGICLNFMRVFAAQHASPFRRGFRKEGLILLILPFCLVCGLNFAINRFNQEADSPRSTGRVYPTDLGVVATNSETEHEIAIVNETDVEWANPSVRASCDCASTSVWPSRVLPGHTAKATVVYRANERTGSFRKKIFIQFENAPLIILAVHGTIMEWATIRSADLNFGPFTPGSEMRAYDLIVDYSRCVASKVAAKSTSDWLRISPTLIDLEFIGRSKTVKHSITVDVGLLKQAGRHLALIQLSSDSATEKPVDVKVSARISPVIVPEPERLFVADIRPGTTHIENVVFKNVSTGDAVAPTNIIVSDSLSEFLVCTESHRGGLQPSTEIRVAIPANSQPQFVTGFILFKTGENVEIRIPVSFRIST
jgi:hypothetical protein